MQRQELRVAHGSLTAALVGLLLAAAVHAQTGAADSAAGKALYADCAFCHGAQGEGDERADAPKLTGYQAPYLTRQLQDFRDGRRGYLEDDIPGRQMALVSAVLADDAAIHDVVAYIQGLPDTPAPAAGSSPGRAFVWDSPYAEMGPGNPARGESAYAVCGNCHGLQGEGVEVLGAPPLRGIQDWYLVRQMKYYRDGIRGAHPSDAPGQSMAIMAKTLGPEDQTIYDLVAYLNTL